MKTMEKLLNNKITLTGLYKKEPRVLLKDLNESFNKPFDEMDTLKDYMKIAGMKKDEFDIYTEKAKKYVNLNIEISELFGNNADKLTENFDEVVLDKYRQLNPEFQELEYALLTKPELKNLAQDFLGINNMKLNDLTKPRKNKKVTKIFAHMIKVLNTNPEQLNLLKPFCGLYYSYDYAMAYVLRKGIQFETINQIIDYIFNEEEELKNKEKLYIKIKKILNTNVSESAYNLFNLNLFNLICYALLIKANIFLSNLNEILLVSEEYYSAFPTFLEEEFYTKINLNELTPKIAKELCGLRLRNFSELELVLKEYITLNKLKKLSNETLTYSYKMLQQNITNIDDRITIIEELNNLQFNVNQKNGKKIISNITKPIFQMIDDINCNPFKIKDKQKFLIYLGLKSELVNVTEVKEEDILIYEALSPIPTTVRNIKDAKTMLLQTSEVKKALDFLQVDDEFVDTYKENIFKALNTGEIEIINTYPKSSYITNSISNNFRLIAKAFLMGKEKYQLLKYSEEDIRTELNTNLTSKQFDIWKQNTSITEGEYTVREVDDFENLIRIGQYPIKTCMNWDNGCYNHCVLSNFDSNKKLIQITHNGEIVARSIIRLTKVTKKLLEEVDNTYGFKDVEKLDEITVNNFSNDESKLVIFIERIYRKESHDLKTIKNLMVKLMKEKVAEMGVKLYTEFNVENSKKVNEFMYISKSKNGYQYLDSLNGESKPGKGGTYHRGYFYSVNG